MSKTISKIINKKQTFFIFIGLIILMVAAVFIRQSDLNIIPESAGSCVVLAEKYCGQGEFVDYGDGSFIFEMKSGGGSLLEQIRKGLSQLYEYRYRYRNAIGGDSVSLCLVLPENPTSIPWVTDYLCTDREINICWFDEDAKPSWPDLCKKDMAVLGGSYLEH